jgi:hypothetical protein
MAASRQVCLAALIVWSSGQAGIHAQPRPPLDGQTRQSLEAFLDTFEGGTKHHYIASLVDLNGDRRPEAIVYLTGSTWCGSGGCTTLVLKRHEASWQLVTEIGITRLPIRAFAARSNGWRNLGVWVQGGGIQPGYEAELSFNGKQYPSNPTVAPARRANRTSTAEMLIRPTGSTAHE